MFTLQYKKGWLITTAIARSLIGIPVGDRIPTIQEYVDLFETSRGVIQNALQILQDEGAVMLEKRGKSGTFITALNQSVLFRLADILSITGSMGIPYSDKPYGLATGVSICMSNCPAPFNFAFVSGSGHRLNALRRGDYDFVIVSKSTANHLAGDITLEIAVTLNNCHYSEPYVFCSRGADITEPRDGMTIAVDPDAIDQFQITQRLCEGKDITFIQRTLITCRALFLEHKADGVVFFEDEWTKGEEIWTHPISPSLELFENTPVIVIQKSEQAIGKILRIYLRNRDIASIQKQVMSKEIEPQF